MSAPRSQFCRMEKRSSRVAHNHEIPGSNTGPATSSQLFCEYQGAPADVLDQLPEGLQRRGGFSIFASSGPP